MEADRRRIHEALLEILPPDRVSRRESDRLAYARDMWPRTLLAVRDRRPMVRPPDVVAWPESAEEIARIVRLAERLSVPLVPFGGGSGVCGGAMAVHGGITLDVKRMDRLVALCPEDQLATFEAGVNGQDLEDALNVRGFTLGHFPSSIYCSTLGGWIAARSAGQLSSRYGKIEDMVEAMEVVIGGGRLLRCGPDDQPRQADLVTGSEGTLGIVTRATLRIHPLPGRRLFRAYEMPRVSAGCEAMRRVMQRGLRPAALRLYDEMDTLLAQKTAAGKEGGRLSAALAAAAEPLHALSADLQKGIVRAALGRAGALSRIADGLLPRLARGGCLLVTAYEVEPALAEAEAALGHAEVLAAGGRDLGEAPAVRWFERRHAVSFGMSPLFAAGRAFVDTMEVASSWSNLLDLYRAVRQALAERALVLAHFSHAYPEGCSIYFTFAAAARDRGAAEALYDDLWRRGLEAASRAGGTISHHHGVGLSKAQFMAREHGASMEIFRQLKRALDPAGVLNPGKMGL